jgi:hypothetical protein
MCQLSTQPSVTGISQQINYKAQCNTVSFLHSKWLTAGPHNPDPVFPLPNVKFLLTGLAVYKVQGI